MWQYTLRSLASHFGVSGEVEAEIVKVDGKRLWKNARNMRENAMLGSFAHAVKAPFRRSA